MREHDSQQTFGVLGQVVKVKEAIAFFGRSATAGDQSREAAVSLPIGCIKQDWWCVFGGDFSSDQEFQSDLLRRHMGADYPCERIVIRDGERHIIKLGSPFDQFIGVGSS